MLVLILYNVFAVPVSICFIDSRDAPVVWFELLFDIIFLIDIGVNFNTAVQTETGSSRPVLDRADVLLLLVLDRFPSSRLAGDRPSVGERRGRERLAEASLQDAQDDPLCGSSS